MFSYFEAWILKKAYSAPVPVVDSGASLLPDASYLLLEESSSRTSTNTKSTGPAHSDAAIADLRAEMRVVRATQEQLRKQLAALSK